VSLVGLVALLSLLAVPLLRLDRSELSAAEGRFAQGALGVSEHDARGSVDGPPAAILRAWSMVVGTTERPLRLLGVLCLLLAALLAGEAAARLAGPRARPVAWLVVAASTFLNRSDLLHPGMFAALPVALSLGSLVTLRTGERAWLVAGLGASLIAPFLGAVILVAVLAITWLSILLEETAPPRRRALIATLSAGALAPGIIGIARSGALEVPDTWAHQPGLLDLFGATEVGPGVPIGFVVVAAALLFGLLRTEGHRRLELGMLVAILITAGVTLALPGSGIAVLDSSWAAAFLPMLALLVALAAIALPRWAWAAVILALAACALLPLWDLATLRLQDSAGTRPDAASRYRSPDETADPASIPAARPGVASGPMRAILAQARALSRPGGRLVVGGPLRYGILYYSRRGHDPGVPLVSIPEDVSPTELSSWLAERVGPTAAPAGPGPTLLMHPPPSPPPPGMEYELVPGSDGRLAWLRFSD
jgi:hypothetical protein